MRLFPSIAPYLEEIGIIFSTKEVNKAIEAFEVITRIKSGDSRGAIEK